MISIFALASLRSMVTTFVTSSDVKKCVRSLNNKHLGKQRLEAVQILTIIKQLRTIARVYSFDPLPSGDTFEDCQLRGQWVKDVRRSYLAQPTRLYKSVENGKLFRIPLSKVKECKSKGTVFTLGFSQHPCVRMWVGYEDALKVYINACINEWVRRGFNNTMKIYKITTDPTFPWWWSCKATHLNHKAVLLRKELARGWKDEWYAKKFSKKIAQLQNDGWMDNGYVWPCNLSREAYENMMSDNPSPEIVCVPITNKIEILNQESVKKKMRKLVKRVVKEAENDENDEKVRDLHTLHHSTRKGTA